MKPLSRAIELAIFDSAIQLDGDGERAEFLDLACASRPDLRARMEKLLAAHCEAERYFSGTTEACAADAGTEAEARDGTPDEPIPDDARLGPYRIIERIGEGGFGVVFLAEQESPVRRRVALKVIRLGMDTERVIARFEAERQALAMMDHPGIAHVLDAGATPTGRPYFAMEWVCGSRITTFCLERALTVRQRVALFIEVCHAIQHAHQKGVIHRDIKASNVLVAMQDGNATPKIIDFGIAKAMDASGRAAGLTESGGQPLGTLAAMSPEQASSGGIDVDTRSDVYSLGVLLYELLCGKPPIDPAELAATSPANALEILLSREAVPPSVVIAQSAAANDTARLPPDVVKSNAAVRGDLDHVVLKCLEKERARRYETVNGLAQDLKRYLANIPVSARAPSLAHQLRKFVRRNRAACISGSLAAAAILAGLLVSMGMYLRANAAFKEQQRLRQVAETARAAESALRQQAQARANVSRAALLLSQGQTEAADAILRQTPLHTIEPSQEATGVFRNLGDWHLLHHRWKAAAECYQLLPLANRFIPSEAIPDTGDMIRTAPVMLLAGMDDAYDAHRALLIERYGGTTNLNAAEQVVKMSLLKPAPLEFIARLQRTVDFLEQNASSDSPRMSMLVNTALALHELRAGHPTEAIARADRALPLTGQDPSSASGDYQAFLGSILVLACRQTSDTARAEAEAGRVREYVQAHGAAFDNPGTPETTNFVPIIERALAMLLAREALAAE